MNSTKKEDIEKTIEFPAIGEAAQRLTDQEKKLIEEIKLLNNAVRELALKNYYKIGTKFYELYQKSYGNDTVAQIAQKAGMSKFMLYKCLKIANLFTDEDIELFCSGGIFVLSYKWVKAFGPLGREAIVEAFKTSVSLNDFKEKMNFLKLEQKEQTSDAKSEHSVEGDSNTDKDSDQTSSDSEKAPSILPLGAKSPEQDDPNDTEMQLPTDSSENKDENSDESNHSDSDTSEKGADTNASSQDINSDKATGEDSTDTGSHNKGTSGNNSTETVPKEDSAGADNFDNGTSASTDNRSDNTNQNNNESNDKDITTATATPKSKKTESNNSAIKQGAGNSLPPNPVKSAGGSINDRINNNSNSKSTNDDLEAIDLAAAGAKLKLLEKENKRLLEIIDELETENSELKQEVERLRSQLSEEFFDTYTEGSLQSSEKEEEKEVEMA